MIVRKGNILSVTEGAILHQVNCQGVTGSGIAIQIRQKYEEVYVQYLEKYTEALDSGNLQTLLGFAQVVPVSNKLTIVNIFGQFYYGRSKIRYTDYVALDKAVESLTWKLPSDVKLHFPLIGCSLGGVNWSIVDTIIKKHFSEDRLNLWVLN